MRFCIWKLKESGDFMSKLFSGLEAFGLAGLSKMKLYEKETKEDEGEKKKEVVQPKEEDFIFDKTYNCTVCDKEFKAKTIRTGKAKLVSSDTDLRPRYHVIDAIKYDVIVCPACGYAAMTRFFPSLSSAQIKLIRENIGKNFTGIKDVEGSIYTYDDAITRYKLALVTSIVKRGKTSERAYTCLKIAWLLRGKSETLPENTPNLEEIKKELLQEEMECLLNAYTGFLEASSKENYPICGMDENTVMYLLAGVAGKLGKYEDANRWISRILVSREANERVKKKARELKETLKEEAAKGEVAK